MFGVILYGGLIFLSLFCTYMIIKTAVKHAIRESLDDIERTIKNAVSQNKNQ